MIEVFNANTEQKAAWWKLNTFLKITRWGSRDGEDYERTSYYMSDLKLKASDFLTGIRQHWNIENCLHWTKDVTFKEDRCRARIGNGPVNLSLFRSFAISVLAKKGNQITQIMRLVTNKPEKIAELLE